MKRRFIVSFIFISLCFLIFSCKDRNLNTWVQASDGTYYQTVVGDVSYNYELREGVLTVYAHLISDNEIQFQFYCKNRWFEERKVYLKLANVELVEDVQGLDIVPDSLVSQYGVGLFRSTNLKENGSNIKKLVGDSSVLCVTGNFAEQLLADMLYGGGSTLLILNDGTTKYQFRLYYKGL